MEKKKYYVIEKGVPIPKIVRRRRNPNVVVFGSAPATAQTVQKGATSNQMTAKNPNAVALGSMGKGRKKTMSPEAIQQRRAATKSRLAKAKKKKDTKNHDI